MQDSNDSYNAESHLYDLNTQEYDMWVGNKIIIMYDNLLNNTMGVIKQLSTFLEKEPKLGNFEKNIEQHRDNALKLYCEIGNNKSLTYKKNI